MKYAVNEDGLNAMHSVVNSIQSSLESIIEMVKIIRNSINNHSGCMGPHETSLEEALSQIDENVKTASEPANSVADKLNEVAEAYQEIIENNNFSNNTDSINNSAQLSNTQGKGGAFSRIIGLGDKNSSNNTPSFSGFETGKLENGSNVIKGEHYSEYISDYYSSEDSTFVRSEGIVVETISPSSIEGIHLDDRDINNPSVFWGMHNSSKEFFEETASHIPEVQSALNSGKTVDELKNDPLLGTCTSIYFDPQKIPRVEKNDGYYTFDGDGRHRIIAAREYGYNIPVRIVGKRIRQKV